MNVRIVAEQSLIPLPIARRTVKISLYKTETEKSDTFITTGSTFQSRNNKMKQWITQRKGISFQPRDLICLYFYPCLIFLNGYFLTTVDSIFLYLYPKSPSSSTVISFLHRGGRNCSRPTLSPTVCTLCYFVLYFLFFPFLFENFLPSFLFSCIHSSYCYIYQSLTMNWVMKMGTYLIFPSFFYFLLNNNLMDLLHLFLVLKYSQFYVISLSSISFLIYIIHIHI